MPSSVLISGSGPWQWEDLLCSALRLDVPEATQVVQVSASLDGWAVEVTLPDAVNVDGFVAWLERYLDSDYDPWEVNLMVTCGIQHL